MDQHEIETTDTDHGSNGAIERRPANFDDDYPPALRLEILETYEANRENNIPNTSLFEKHSIDHSMLSNWRVSLRRGRLHPDPELHPHLIDQYSALRQETSDKPPEKARRMTPDRLLQLEKARQARGKNRTKVSEAKPEREIPRRRRSAASNGSQVKSLSATLVESIEALEEENQSMREVLLHMRDVLDEYLDDIE